MAVTSQIWRTSTGLAAIFWPAVAWYVSGITLAAFLERPAWIPPAGWNDCLALGGPAALLALVIFARAFSRVTGLAVAISGALAAYSALAALIEWYAETTAWGSAVNPYIFVLSGIILLEVAFTYVMFIMETGYVTGFLTMRLRRALGQSGYQRDPRETQGSARWATPREVRERFRVGSQSGLVVGTEIGARWDEVDVETAATAPLVTHGGKLHTLVLAGSGGGKTQGIIIPSCITWSSSLVVLDPKGEIAAATARYRREVLGQDVYVVDGETASIDVLEPLRRVALYDPDDIDRVSRRLAQWMVPIPSNAGGNTYFYESAQRVVRGVLVEHATTAPESMGLDDVMDFITNGLDHFKERISRLSPRAWRTLGDVPSQKDTQIGLILSTAITVLEFVNDPKIRRILGGSGAVGPSSILQNGTTIYLKLSSTILDETPGLARVIVGSLISTIMDEDGRELAVEQGQADRVAFILDEVAKLGHLDPLLTALEQGRGAGIDLVLVYQSVGQISDTYGASGVDRLFANAEYQIALLGGIRHVDTAKQISARLGQVPILSPSANTGVTGGTGNPGFAQGGANANAGARPLLTADEIMDGVGGHYALVMGGGGRPAMLGRPLFHLREDLQELAACERPEGERDAASA